MKEERYVADERRNPDRRIQSDRRLTPRVIASSILRRLSWQGLLIGTLLGLAIQVALFVLGMAIGIYTPGAGSLTTRIGLWEILMTVGALLPAGYAGGRAANIPSRKETVLHGALIWALTILAAPSLGGRIGVASAFAIPADLPSALWAFAALAAGLVAVTVSAWFATPSMDLYLRHDFPKPANRPGPPTVI